MTIRTLILEIIAGQALMDPADLRLEARPQDMGLDSLAMVESIFALEEAFDIAIPFNAQDPRVSGLDISTIGAFVASVEALVAARL